MADYTLISDTLPELVLEIARRLEAEESALSTPINNVTIAHAETRATISASIPVVAVLDATNADLKFSVANYTNYAGAITATGTALNGKGATHTAEALTAALFLLDGAEQAAIAAGATLPTGVGTDYSINGSTMTVNCVVPITYALNAQGQQTIVASNYLP
jgi:hypothetical protein